jgi:hypothetical protein
VIPIAQAILWEIFPPHQRGMAIGRLGPRHRARPHVRAHPGRLGH